MALWLGGRCLQATFLLSGDVTVDNFNKTKFAVSIAAVLRVDVASISVGDPQTAPSSAGYGVRGGVPLAGYTTSSITVTVNFIATSLTVRTSG